MNYKGTIIAESLSSPSILKKVSILETNVKPSQSHTPWAQQWTTHRVEINEDAVEDFAVEISHSFDPDHPHWFADFQNENYHYIVFPDRVFKVDLENPNGYKEAKAYGVSIRIPEGQLNFT